MPKSNWKCGYNSAPTQDFAACRLDEDGNLAVAKLRWGLVPFWVEDSKVEWLLINVRAESVHYKPSFVTAFHFRRCLVPANGWFEWQRTRLAKQPFFLALGTDHRCRSPRFGSAGTGPKNPWRPSPSSRRRPRRRWPPSTIDNRRSLTPTGSTSGSIRHRRSHGSSSFCANPVPVPTRGAPSVEGKQRPE